VALLNIGINALKRGAFDPRSFDPQRTAVLEGSHYTQTGLTSLHLLTTRPKHHAMPNVPLEATSKLKSEACFHHYKQVDQLYSTLKTQAKNKLNH
jgi:hypothetical protein